MFRLRNLFALSITVGHQLFYSTPMLDFFYLGVISGFGYYSSFMLYKLKEILFSLLLIRNFLISIMKRQKFKFFLIFSNLSQYLIISSLFSLLYYRKKRRRRKKKKLVKQLPVYFMLSPRVGFLSSMTERILSVQKDAEFSINSSLDDTIAISFGDSVLPMVVKEVAAKRGIVIAIVDSNQVNV